MDSIELWMEKCRKERDAALAEVEQWRQLAYRQGELLKQMGILFQEVETQIENLGITLGKRDNNERID